MGMDALRKYGFPQFDADQEAIKDFCDSGAYIQAFLVGCGMIENLLARLLDADTEADAMLNCVHELAKRADRVLPKESHLPEDVEQRIYRIAETRRHALRDLGRTDARGINATAKSYIPEVLELLRTCRSWVETFGAQLDYCEGVVLSRREGEDVRARALYDFVSRLQSHTLYPPEFVKDELEKHGLQVTVTRIFAGQMPAGIVLFSVKGDWGEGISALSLAETVYKLIKGKPPKMNYIGRGFQFDDTLRQIEELL